MNTDNARAAQLVAQVEHRVGAPTQLEAAGDLVMLELEMHRHPSTLSQLR